MSINRPVVMDPAGLARPAQLGDILVTNDVVPAANANTAVTLTGQLLGLGIFLSSAASAPTLTFDSAANIIAALATQYGFNQNAQSVNGTTIYNSIQPGTTFRVKIIMSTAYAATIAATANTGVTVNRGTVAASSSKDFLITINNGTPVQTFAPASTNASAILTGFSQVQLAQLSVGMVVTNSALGLQGATITSINLAAGSVTMSTTANATATATSLTFSPVITVDGL